MRCCRSRPASTYCRKLSTLIGLDLARELELDGDGRELRVHQDLGITTTGASCADRTPDGGERRLLVVGQRAARPPRRRTSCDLPPHSLQRRLDRALGSSVRGSRQRRRSAAERRRPTLATIRWIVSARRRQSFRTLPLHVHVDLPQPAPARRKHVGAAPGRGFGARPREPLPRYFRIWVPVSGPRTGSRRESSRSSVARISEALPGAAG